MAIQQKLGLSTRLSQRLILTPSLQQAIKLLPLTTLELAEVLEQEVMENPLLEEVPQEQPTAEEIAQEEAKAEREDPLKEIDVEKFFEDYLDDGDHRRTRSAEVPELPPIENTLTEQPDLYDHLMWQLHMSASDELLRNRYASQNAADLGVPIPDIDAALWARNISAFKAERVAASKILNGPSVAPNLGGVHPPRRRCAHRRQRNIGSS